MTHHCLLNVLLTIGGAFVLALTFDVQSSVIFLACVAPFWAWHLLK